MLYLALCVMIVLICTLTIAYSVLSTTLNITGSSNVNGASWNITIDKFYYWKDAGLTSNEAEYPMNVDNMIAYYNGLAFGNAKLVKEPTISGTTISDFQISLVKPIDAVILYYTVTNSGTIPAKLDSIIQKTPTFASSTNNASDIELVSNNWFSMVNLYSNQNDLNTINKELAVGYILCPGETIYFEFGAQFYETAPALPSSNVTVSNIGATFNFVQADKSTCSNS